MKFDIRMHNFSPENLFVPNVFFRVGEQARSLKFHWQHIRLDEDTIE